MSTSPRTVSSLLCCRYHVFLSLQVCCLPNHRTKPLVPLLQKFFVLVRSCLSTLLPVRSTVSILVNVYLSTYTMRHEARRLILSNVLQPRQTTIFPTTCGYADGDLTRPRTADRGFNCRTDALNSLWGFCPTSVITATDCGFAGNCVDAFSCTFGCGIFGNTNLATFTWYVSVCNY